jgi:hypothetical protein
VDALHELGQQRFHLGQHLRLAVAGRQLGQDAELLEARGERPDRLDDRARVLGLGDDLLRAGGVAPELRLALELLDLLQPLRVGSEVKDSP